MNESSFVCLRLQQSGRLGSHGRKLNYCVQPGGHLGSHGGKMCVQSSGLLGSHGRNLNHVCPTEATSGHMDASLIICVSSQVATSGHMDNTAVTRGHIFSTWDILRKMVWLPLITRSYFMSVPVFLCRSGYVEESNGLKGVPLV